MTKFHYIFFLILFIGIEVKLKSQISYNKNEILALLNSKDDTNKVNNLIDCGFELENTNIDSALLFYFKAKDICDKINFKTGRIRAYFNISYIYNLKNEYDKGLRINIQSVRESNLIQNQELLAKSFFNLGASYTYLNNYNKAIKYYEVAAKFFNKSKNKKHLALLYGNIASCYNNSTNTNFDTILFNKAIEYYNLAINSASDINDTALIITNYLNISSTYLNLGKASKMNTYLNKALLLSEKFGNENLRASAYELRGQYYLAVNDYKNALLISQKGLVIFQENGNLHEEIKCLKTISNSYFYLGQIKEAEQVIDKAMVICDSISSLSDKNTILMTYAKIKHKNGKINEAYIGLMDLINISDSINSEDMRKQFTDLEAKYAGEKKELQIRNQSAEILAKEKQNKQKTIIIICGALGLLATAIFGSLAFFNYRKTKKQNLIIENQKMQVEMQNEEIVHQKELIEEKQKEIIDSINYAKRIQSAVLPDKFVWEKVSKEHFIFFKPKDIVSGDFYWAYNTPNNRSVFALADCTGHGVPGGFMSMLGNSLLNEIVIDNKLFKTDIILNKLRSKIITALEQNTSTVKQKDGMDISLCVWNKLDNTLEFSGANNPLWLLRNNEIIEYKADKMPVGYYLEDEIPFSSTIIQLQKGDIIYLCTDGFADQFGGPSGKKFKYKPLINLLLSISNKTMELQKNELELVFNNWRNKLEQVDDVSIVAIKI